MDSSSSRATKDRCLHPRKIVIIVKSEGRGQGHPPCLRARWQVVLKASNQAGARTTCSSPSPALVISLQSPLSKRVKVISLQPRILNIKGARAKTPHHFKAIEEERPLNILTLTLSHLFVNRKAEKMTNRGNTSRGSHQPVSSRSFSDPQHPRMIKLPRRSGPETSHLHNSNNVTNLRPGSTAASWTSSKPPTPKAKRPMLIRPGHQTRTIKTIAMFTSRESRDAPTRTL